MKECMNECGTSKYMGSPAQPHHKIAENGTPLYKFSIGYPKRPANVPLKFMLGNFFQIYDTLHHKLILRTGIVPQFENDPYVFINPILSPYYTSLCYVILCRFKVETNTNT